MAKPKTTTSKVEYKKLWRRKNTEDRRFNKLLKLYLKVKHVDIYSECCTFFEILNEENPTSRDLTKTSTFKKWEKKVKKHQNSSANEPCEIILNTYYMNTEAGETTTFTTVVQETIHAEKEPETADEAPTAVVQEETAQVEQAANNNDQIINDLQQEQAANNIDQIINELQQEQAANNNDQIINELQQVPADNIIDQIINDLQQEQAANNIDQIINELQQVLAIHELLNDIENDERREDDDEGIGLNIEDEIVDPFDFDLEVGLLDY